jgi:hypothetical protein
VRWSRGTGKTFDLDHCEMSAAPTPNVFKRSGLMTQETRSSRGLGSLAFSIIPAALGGAACLWVLAATNWIDLTNELRQERRAAERVGIMVLPKTPINVTVNEDGCLKVPQSYLDGSRLSVYVENRCHNTLQFSKYDESILAPDKTVIHSTNNYLPGSTDIRAGERREIILDVPSDDRTDTVNIRLIDGRS